MVGPVALTTRRCSSSARARRAPGASPSHARRRPSARGRAPRLTPRQLAQPLGQPLAQLAHATASSAGSARMSSAACAAARDHRAAGEGRAVVAGLEDVGEPRPDDQRADRQPAAERPWRRSSRRARRPSARRPTACPVRPIPVWTSSKTSAAPARSQAARAACSTSSPSGCTPLSPWTGSSSTAAVSLVDGGVDRLGGRRDRRRSPARAARTAPAWTPAAWPTARRRCARGSRRGARRARRRGLRLAHELDRRLVGLGAGVGEEHRARRASDAASRSASATIGAVVEQVGDVDQPRRPARAPPRRPRVAVPGVADADAREEVEVLVPRRRRAARSPRPRRTRPGSARRFGASALTRPGRIFVPRPASVNSSSSSECGTRPSTMCAKPTPPWIASRHACSFGRMPPRDRRRARPRPRRRRPREITESGSAGSRSQPGDVGEEDDLVGAERARHGGRGLVGVDVVRAPVAVGADRGDHRDVVRGDVLDHAGVDALDAPDEADVLAARALHRRRRGTAARRRRRARPPAARGG